MIQCNELVIGYPSKQMGPYNLSISRGELQVLLGRNGVGKSTLLKTLLAILNPLNGTLQIDGQALQHLAPTDRSRKIAYVASVNPRVAHLSVAQLLSIQPQLKRASTSQVQEALEEVQITHLKSKFLEQLSDGEIQKAFIARALVQDADFIILDEPLSHLDISSRLEIFALLKRIAHEKNKGVFFSSHDLDLAIAMADGISLMNSHEIIQDIPEDLVVSGAITEHFGGPHLSFNPHRGKFELCFEQEKEISVSGTGMLHQWVVHALRRSAFGVIESTKDSKVHVEDSIQYNGKNYAHIAAFLKDLNHEK